MRHLKVLRPRICIALGTRPEIIKLSSILRLLPKSRFDFDLIHTGQHYSYEMDRVFFKELRLPQPNFPLSIRSAGLHGDHVSRMMVAIERILFKTKPEVLLIQGDTNSVLAAVLVASKIPRILIGHVEAGLRSGDRSMPEENNRIVADAVSHLLFAPTTSAKKNLLREGFDAKNIFVTGNTGVDAMFQCAAIAGVSARSGRPGVKKRTGYFLLTLHRQENVDDAKRLRMILDGLARIHSRLGRPILFPAHPRTLERLKRFHLRLPAGVRWTKAAGFLQFLKLESEADLILTDSGGVQEEACILKVPCVTLRTTTERPETLEVGSNVLAGSSSKQILKAAQTMIARPRRWKNPFGDGRAGERIIHILERRVG